jgi:hypothetical protein
MSNYTRDSYRRRRQEEQLMFQRIIAEEAQIQNFLLLQHDGGVTEFIGGETSDPIPSEVTTRFYAYNDGVTTTNFTQLNYFDVKDAYTNAVNNNWSLLGESFRSFVPVAVGVQLYTFITMDPYTTSGNYVINSNRIMSVNSSGVVTAIVNFGDIS